MEQNHENKRLHLDFRDPCILELYSQLWREISAKKENPHFLLLYTVIGVLINPTNESIKETLRDVTKALSRYPNSEALRKAQFILIDKLRQASISPFKNDPREKEEFNMLFDYIDREGNPILEVIDHAEEDEVLPEAYELSDLPEDPEDAEWELDWEAEWDAERVAEWMAELDVAIEEYLRLQIELEHNPDDL